MTRRVDAPGGTSWTVKRLIVPMGMRPVGPSAAMGMQDGVQLALPQMLLGAVFFVVMLPFLPIVLGLRALRVTPWTIEATSRPWGRRGPPVVMHWQIRGRHEADAALASICEQFEQGAGAPAVAGAEHID
jgi:hypothetical protein